MFHSTILVRLAAVTLLAGGAARASLIFTPNSWQLDVYGTSNGLDQDGFPTFVTLSDTSNTFLNPEPQIGVGTECTGGCISVGKSAMGTFLATANLSTFSIGVAVTGVGEPPQDFQDDAQAMMQINIPLIGTIAPGNVEQGSVSLSLDGTGTGDSAVESQPNTPPSLAVSANLTTCTYDMTVHDTLGDDCFAPSASAEWTSEPQTCTVDGQLQPGCFGISSLPGVLSSDFLVYSDLTILHVEISLGAHADDGASADLSHTASFTITPPPGFTVDYSAFEPMNTAAAPEPGAYGFLLAGAAAILWFARRKNRRSVKP